MEASVNIVKEKILHRLHRLEGVCDHCGKRECGHAGNTSLPAVLNTENVLKAIGYDNGERFI